MSCIGTPLITSINSSGLHRRAALLPFNQALSFHGPSYPSPIRLCLLLSPFLAKTESMEHSCCTSYPLSTRLVPGGFGGS